MRPVRRRRCDGARIRECAVQRSVVVAAMIAFAGGAVAVAGGEIGVDSAQGATQRRRCAGLCRWRWPCLARQVALRIVLVCVYSRSHSAMWSEGVAMLA